MGCRGVTGSTPRQLSFRGSGAAEDGEDVVPSPRTNSGTTSPATAVARRIGEMQLGLLQEPGVTLVLSETGCGGKDKSGRTEELVRERGRQQEREAKEARAKLMLELVHEAASSPQTPPVALSNAGGAVAAASGNRPKSRKQR